MKTQLVPGTPQHAFFYFISAAVCLEAILTTVAQSLYQAIIGDKPVVLTEDNVYEVLDNVDHGSSNCLKVACMPIGSEFQSTPGDVIRVRLPEFDGWAMVHGMVDKFGHDTGMSIEFSLMLLDDSFCPHSSLLSLA